MAFTPSRDPTALQESADAFVATVARLSGVPLRAQVASDYAGVIEALRSRRVDLAFVHPVGYVRARREAGCEILVRDVWENRTAYKASFYVREASGIKHIEELRGRTVAFVDPASSSGYIYPMVLLMKRGLVRTFFKDALFARALGRRRARGPQGRVDVATTFDRVKVHLEEDPALAARLLLQSPSQGGGIFGIPGLPGAVRRSGRRYRDESRHATAGDLRHRRLREARDAAYDPVGTPHADGLPAGEIARAPARRMRDRTSR